MEHLKNNFKISLELGNLKNWVGKVSCSYLMNYKGELSWKIVSSSLAILT